MQDAAWRSELVRPASLAVALDKSYAKSLGLPRTMRWPWDNDKGVYVLNSGHELHCLVKPRPYFDASCLIHQANLLLRST